MTHTAILERAEAAMSAAGIDALLVGPGSDLRYLTGYHAPELERLTMLVDTVDTARTLVVPRLERSRAEASGAGESVAIVDYDETDDPYAIACELLGHTARLIAVGDRLWSVFLLTLQRVLPEAAWTPASSVTSPLRMRKAPHEIDALRRAGAAIDRVHGRVPQMLRPGRTEAEIGKDIADAIVEEGHEEVRFVIVASGPNAASPHHETSDRRLVSGDAVVVDIGGSVDGYCSDCTRTYLVGDPPEGFLAAHEALESAQAAAVAAVRPGVTAASVDAAARQLLDEAGYGQYFIHRTGHGIGLDEHEEPYIVAGNERALEPGMAFSIEPGIYVEGRYGMRIEDIVVVTGHGCERLNEQERAVVVVP